MEDHWSLLFFKHWNILEPCFLRWFSSTTTGPQCSHWFMIISWSLNTFPRIMSPQQEFDVESANSWKVGHLGLPKMGDYYSCTFLRITFPRSGAIIWWLLFSWKCIFPEDESDIFNIHGPLEARKILLGVFKHRKKLVLVERPTWLTARRKLSSLRLVDPKLSLSSVCWFADLCICCTQLCHKCTEYRSRCSKRPQSGFCGKGSLGILNITLFVVRNCIDIQSAHTMLAPVLTINKNSHDETYSSESGPVKTHSSTRRVALGWMWVTNIPLSP